MRCWIQLIHIAAICIGVQFFEIDSSQAEMPPHTQNRSEIDYKPVSVDSVNLQKDRSAIERSLESRELTDLSEPLAPLLKKIGIQQLLVSPGFTRAVFIRYGVRPLKPHDDGSVVQTGPNQFVYHARTASGIPFAAFFAGYEKVQINRLLFDMTHATKKFSSSASAAKLLLFGSNAYAELICDERGLYSNLKGTLRSIKNNKMKCLKSVLWSALETQGAVLTTLYNYDKLGKTWEAMKDLWENMEIAFQENYDGFFNLPEVDQAEIACDIFGTVFSTTIVGIMSSGASAAASGVGIAKKMATMTAKIAEKVAASAKAGTAATRTGTKVAGGTFKAIQVSKANHAAESVKISQTLSEKFETSRCIPREQMEALKALPANSAQKVIK